MDYLDFLSQIVRIFIFDLLHVDYVLKWKFYLSSVLLAYVQVSITTLSKMNNGYTKFKLMNYGNDITLRTPLALYWRFVSPIKNQTIYLQAEEWKTVTITFIKYTQFTEMLLTNNIGNNKENIVLNTTEYLMHF